MDIFIELFRETISVFTGPEFALAYKFVYVTSPFWLPFFLAISFWYVWVNYIRSRYIASLEYILLEIKLPPEVYKSPLAMELVLNGLYTTAGETGWYKLYIRGSTRAYFSFEIVSLEGNVHLYVWARKITKNIIESQFYSQYPNIEITEVPDYTDMVAHYDPSIYNLWGAHYKLKLPDPYPIKTYLDFGLEKDPKEEFKVDPLSAVIEYLSVLGKGEYACFQFVFRAHKEKAKGGSWFKKTTWQDEAREIIDEIYENMENVQETEDGERRFRRSPTKGESMALERLERIITKPAFDVGVRSLYFAKPENYKGVNIPGLVNIFKQFGGVTFDDKSHNLAYSYNTLAISGATDYDYPWHDFRKIREMSNRYEIVDAYRRRQFFHTPHKMDEVFVLSTEELATLFHPIGTVLQTSNIERISSRKAEPPRNLPR